MVDRTNVSAGAGKNQVRIQTSILSGLEQKALLWMAACTPAWITPTTYTGVGVVGAGTIFAGYALTRYYRGFLWLATGGFVLHWLGDSMDGTLARYRKIERPRYGFFVDHIIDVVAVTVIFIGLGLSPFMRFNVAMLSLAAFLMVTLFVYLSTAVSGVFTISYGGLGPTETRFLAVLANTVFFFFDVPSLRVAGYEITFLEIVAVAVGVICCVIFLVGAVKTAHRLLLEDRTARHTRPARRTGPSRRTRPARRTMPARRIRPS